MKRARRERGELTPRQRLFANAYANNPNATQAALTAGYSPATAKQQGSRLLTNVDVKRVVDEQLEKREAKIELRAELLDQAAAELALADPKDAYDAEGRLLPVHQMPLHVRRAIAGFEEEALFEGRGEERVQVGVVRKVKWANRREAVELGMKRLGLLKEQVQHSGEVRVIDPYAAPERERR